MAEEPTSAEPEYDTWQAYIVAEQQQLLDMVGPDLALAMIHSRAIDSPDFYFKSLQYYEDMAKYHYGTISSAGYWELVALRAIVLLNVPIPIREQMIAEAKLRNMKARERVRAKVKKGPGGPYKEVDLSKLEL